LKCRVTSSAFDNDGPKSLKRVDQPLRADNCSIVGEFDCRST
jgi:hypothetical protein